MRTIYLDNAATTPVHPDVITVMTESLTHIFGNPSSTHSFGRDAKASLEESRRKIAKILDVKPGEIFFTSCGTESNNTIIKNSISNMGVKRILTTSIEHPSIYNTCQSIDTTVSVEYIPLDKEGSVILPELESMLSSNPAKTLISVMHANNEVGILNDLSGIATLSHQYGALFHSDMVQTMGHLPISLQSIPLDFASVSAHKFHGPKGVGFMYVRQPNQLQAFITGGSQERGNRSGTENLASIVGMARALELATKNIEDDVAYLNSLRTYMKKKLETIIPEVQFLTELDRSLCTILSVVFPPKWSSDMLLFQLDMLGIACSGGSACSSGANKPSHVLAHFDIPTDSKVVRFSFSKFNNIDEIDYAVGKIKELMSETAK